MRRRGGDACTDSRRPLTHKIGGAAEGAAGGVGGHGGGHGGGARAVTRGPPQRDGAELGKTIPTGGPHLSVSWGILGRFRLRKFRQI